MMCILLKMIIWCKGHLPMGACIAAASTSFGRTYACIFQNKRFLSQMLRQ
ncbi:hypothetical protein Hanom_Chr13g01222701 [Helianthus anomalus]